MPHEASTGRTSGKGDIEAQIFLAKGGQVTHGMIFDFQNEVGQSMSVVTTVRLVGAGYRVSVVHYIWWSPYLSG